MIPLVYLCHGGVLWQLWQKDLVMGLVLVMSGWESALGLMGDVWVDCPKSGPGLSASDAFLKH